MSNTKPELFKRLYTAGFDVIADYTIRVTATSTITAEKVTEVFVVKDRAIFPELIDELPHVLEDYETNNDYLVQGITLRTVVQNLIDSIGDYFTVPCC